MTSEETYQSSDAAKKYYRFGLESAKSRDWKQAFHFYNAAVKAGSKKALSKLGQIYDCGMNAVRIDIKKAVSLYKESHNAGIQGGTIMFASCMISGLAISKDESTAYELLKPLASCNPYAAAEFVRLEPDEKFSRYAIEELTPLDGDSYTALTLADVYTIAIKDDVKATYYHKIAAEQGMAASQRSLGIRYEEGRGIDEDQHKAFRWYQKASDQGDMKAMCYLAECYQFGIGTKINIPLAIEFYRAATNEGYSRAQRILGGFYERGGYGITQDTREAVRLYRLSAAQGDITAVVILGACYQRGVGVTKNMSIAISMYKKAAINGNDLAKARLKYLCVS